MLKLGLDYTGCEGYTWSEAKIKKVFKDGLDVSAYNLFIQRHLRDLKQRYLQRKILLGQKLLIKKVFQKFQTLVME